MLYLIAFAFALTALILNFPSTLPYVIFSVFGLMWYSTTQDEPLGVKILTIPVFIIALAIFF